MEEKPDKKELPIIEKNSPLIKYGQVKKNLIIRLENAECGKEGLQRCIYQVAGEDIALTVHLLLGIRGNRIRSVKIPKEYLGLWEKSAQEVVHDALGNMQRLFPPSLFEISRLIKEPEYKGEDFMDPDWECGEKRRFILGVPLSTFFLDNYGGAAVFFPGVMDTLCRQLKCGIYLGFLTVHEAMVHMDRGLDPEHIRRVLEQTIDAAVEDKDILSRNIYHYDPVSRVFSRVRKGEEKNEDTEPESGRD